MNLQYIKGKNYEKLFIKNANRFGEWIIPGKGHNIKAESLFIAQEREPWAIKIRQMPDLTRLSALIDSS